jgi:hypothetical protein
MPLRDWSANVAEAAQTSRTAEARAAVADVLNTSLPSGVIAFDTATLTVAHVDVADAYTLIVFTDGDVHLGARDRGEGWRVWLVDDRDGWTELAEVTSAEQLGEVLPDLDPPPPPVPQPWAEGVAYAAGQRVTYSNSTYEAASAHTASLDNAPNKNTGAWVKVA